MTITKMKKQSIRITLSKKTRFEVFKRDKFKCQYCGREAPNIVLEIDHIKPISKGGINDMLNLVTSCFDCNRGKSNREMNDDSIIIKQRNQLEELQARREQIELMMTWKQELGKLDEDIVNKIIIYIEKKMKPYTLKKAGIKKVEKLLKKFNFTDIIDSIDISASNYLKYDSEENLVQKSVENFFNKIGGILTLKNKSPIDQKIGYIKGICRNRFSYWDNRKGSIILSNYVSALKNYGYSDEEILEDLENEVMPKTINSPHWSAWHTLIGGRTENIHNWEKQNEVNK